MVEDRGGSFWIGNASASQRCRADGKRRHNLGRDLARHVMPSLSYRSRGSWPLSELDFEKSVDESCVCVCVRVEPT